MVAASVVATLVVAVPAAPAAAATVRSVGTDAVEDVIAAAKASARPDCGLSADRLAAMLLAPVFHETGAVWYPNTSPSPMTLGRWDNQAALYAFGDRATGYQRAFWHAGVGMWQFDSAGGWNMTAADAINTQTSANQAAATMASRYCASTATSPVDRMRFAWALWYACVAGTTNVCVDRFNEMFVGGQFTNIRRDATVGRLGGAVPTTCRIGPSTQVPCHRVDPARAQGYRAWMAAGAGPTPLTAPFYVFSRNDREYRYWLSVDTGYDRTVIAHKPIRANARTSLVWSLDSTADALCDLGAARGACGTPRVARTAWGEFVGEPFGSLDSAQPGMGSLRVTGWTIDPDTNDPIDVHVYVDGVWRRSATASVVRPDVGAAVAGYGDAHGYNVRIPNVAPGDRRVCVYAINVAPFGFTNPLIDCADVRVSAPPQGSLDVVRLAPGGAWVAGWAADTDDPASLSVEVLVDGEVAGTGTANRTRRDVGTLFPAFGNQRGAEVAVGFAPGPPTRTICLDAVDRPTGERQRLGCRNLSVPPVAFGNLELVAGADGGVRVRGWLIDWTTANPAALEVRVDGVTVAGGTANRSRADVAAVHRGFDDRRGFDLVAPTVRGPQRVCVVSRGRTIGCGETVVATGAFADVRAGVYYDEASRWMADTGISTGFPQPWLFSPDAGLTRAQAVAMLWRLMGAPPAASVCGWGDPVPTWARAASCWARTAGVVSGVGGDPARFAADLPVTRAELAVMLWRLAGRPAPPTAGGAGVSPEAAPGDALVDEWESLATSSMTFVDVPTGRWFSDAVAWMAAMGVSTGRAEGDLRWFDPGGPVVRAHAAAFLWRLAGTAEAWAVTRPPSAVR